MAEPRYLESSADLDGDFRYGLVRVWDRALPRLLWVMCNPSSADADKLDPTLRRCLGYSQRWGYGGFEVANVYAFRSPDPRVLRRHGFPVGSRNDEAILAALERCGNAIAAWGVIPETGRALHVERLITARQSLLALRLSKGARPEHPLYQAADLLPIVWRPAPREVA